MLLNLISLGTDALQAAVNLVDILVQVFLKYQARSCESPPDFLTFPCPYSACNSNNHE